MSEENQNPPQSPAEGGAAPAPAAEATRPPREGRPNGPQGGRQGNRPGDRPGGRREGRRDRRGPREGGDGRGGERRDGRPHQQGHRDSRPGQPLPPREPQQIQFARALSSGGATPRRDPWQQWIEKVRAVDGVVAPLGLRQPKEVERDPIWQEAISGLPKPLDLMGPVPPDGLPQLRDGVARFLTREGVATTEHDVFVTSGVQHSLTLLALALLDPGTTVLVEKLTRARAIHAFKAANARVEIAPSDNEGLDPRGLDRRLQQGGVRFVYLNPTYREPDDAVLFDKRRQEVAEICARRGVVLVEDDPFREIYYGAPPPRPIPPPPGLFRVHLLDFEMLGSPSIPVAAMTLPAALKDRLVRYVDAQGIRTNRIAQEIAAKLINHNGWNVYLDRLRVTMRKRRDAWLQWIESSLKEHVEYHAPRGGHYLWFRLRSNRPTHQFADVALEHKVAIWPGELFEPYFAESTHFAVSVLDLAPEEVPEAINRLKAAIEKLATIPAPRPRPKPEPPKPPQQQRPPQPKPQPKPQPQQQQRPQQGQPGGQPANGQQQGRRKKRRRERIPNAPWIDEPTDDAPAVPAKPGDEIPLLQVRPEAPEPAVSHAEAEPSAGTDKTGE